MRERERERGGWGGLHPGVCAGLMKAVCLAARGDREKEREREGGGGCGLHPGVCAGLMNAVWSAASGDGVPCVGHPAGCASTTSSQQCLTPEDSVTCSEHCAHARRQCNTLSLTCLAIRLYTFLLEHTFVKVG